MQITGQPHSSAWRRLGMLLLALPGLVYANADVEKNIANSKNWAMQAGDMYNQRYSKLNQINAGNVGNMQVAWTFFKTGSVLFGSGYVLLAFLRADLVQRLHWLTEGQLIDAITGALMDFGNRPWTPMPVPTLPELIERAR